MKNKVTAGILAIFFGWLGVHRFYLGQIGRGVLYLLFSFTMIPLLIGFIDGIVFLTQDKETFDKKYNPGEWALAQLRKEQETERRRPQRPREYVAATPPPPPPAQDPYRKKADELYARYDFEEAATQYRRSLSVDPKQGDVHFRLATIYSILEEEQRSLAHLSEALENGFYDFDEIENNDNLAYLRSTPAYFAFKSNGYRIPVPVPPQAEVPKEEEPLVLSDDLITSIERLARLKEEGILNEEAFVREKQKILQG